jgi:hypothetical protein
VREYIVFPISAHYYYYYYYYYTVPYGREISYTTIMPFFRTSSNSLDHHDQSKCTPILFNLQPVLAESNILLCLKWSFPQDALLTQSLYLGLPRPNLPQLCNMHRTFRVFHFYYSIIVFPIHMWNHPQLLHASIILSICMEHPSLLYMFTVKGWVNIQLHFGIPYKYQRVQHR